MKRLLIVLTIVAAAGAGSSGVSASIGSTHSDDSQPRARCGVFPGGIAYYDVITINTTCAVAKRVTRKWEGKLINNRCERFRCVARGFLCVAKPPARVHYRVKCRRGNQRVAWTISVD